MDVLPGYELILSERVGKVLVLTLNRPDKLNAVSMKLHAELDRIFVDADDDPDSEVIVLTGAGRAFCAGGDVQEQRVAGDVVRANRRVRGSAISLIENFLNVEKPVVGIINGPAIGLGATLALLCDIIVAADDAVISDRHVNVGLVAADGGTVIWPYLVGIARAKEFLMMGRRITGKDAAAMGLVNYAKPQAELKDFALGLAKELTTLMPYSVRATKVAINRMLRQQLLDQMDTTMAWQGIALQREDRLEALEAFHEKREPRFTGR